MNNRHPIFVAWTIAFALPACALGASEETIQKLLERAILKPGTALDEVQKFTESRVPRMPKPANLEQWEAEAKRMRKAVLDDVVYRGEAAAWRNSPSDVVWLETVEGGPGYEIRKLRYEVLPGLWAPALLYLPKNLGNQRVPVVLNVNGHDRKGKAAGYKQLRCINLAKRGMIALNAEWIGMGQLNTPGFQHARMNQLDLCGTSGIALHFLAMSRAIDLLLELPNADPNRLAVAGLSGGGWQTIFISSLDTRVKLCNPVAGYSSFRTRAYHHSDLGDSEQTPNDLAIAADYAQLTAMLAPRRALLTYNVKDNCCFAAGHALPPLLEAAEPIYALYGKDENLRSHINLDPGDHNFEQDNRQAFYRALGDFFFAGDDDYDAEEIVSDDEVKPAERLFVELPENNLDFHKLAISTMKSLPKPGGNREQLAEVVRARDFAVEATKIGQEQSGDVTAVFWKLTMNGELSVPVVEFSSGKTQGTTILVADGGRAALAAETGALLAKGRRVLAADPFYFGESGFERRAYLWALLVAAVGERSIGIQASQIVAVAKWAGEPADVISIGPRSSVFGLVAAALEPDTIKNHEARQGLASLKSVIEQDWTVTKAPELFCFGLLEKFDVPQLQRLAAKGEERP